jgi:predicted ester cyclase
MMGIAPTENQVRVEGITISHIQRGKIVQEWELFDTLGLMQQLGAAPHS